MLRGVRIHSQCTRRLCWGLIHPAQSTSRQFAAKHHDDNSPSAASPPNEPQNISSRPSTEPPTESSTTSPHAVEESQLSRLLGQIAENGAALRLRADEVVAMAAARASRLGESLNKVTGYHEIEQLKRAVVENGTHANIIYFVF